MFKNLFNRQVWISDAERLANKGRMGREQFFDLMARVRVANVQGRRKAAAPPPERLTREEQFPALTAHAESGQGRRNSLVFGRVGLDRFLFKTFGAHDMRYPLDITWGDRTVSHGAQHRPAARPAYVDSPFSHEDGNAA